ncbi:hypothetical protein SN811_21410 [Ligilactobacillus agilis]|uniref:Uncharacterized protein n=1 Tax=Ligilactobacillus agilis TaxID=1601 RepID=A0A6F9Y7T9_9LACO|nr:hypothetical protein SN811_21410 [Ligilactobacillus agilis]
MLVSSWKAPLVNLIQNYSTKKLHDREAMEKKEYVSNQFRMSDLMGSLTV